MKKLRIIENAWVAKMAAKKLGHKHIAIVFGKTIYRHNTKATHFLNNKRWTLHELKHVYNSNDTLYHADEILVSNTVMTNNFSETGITYVIVDRDGYFQ